MLKAALRASSARPTRSRPSATRTRSRPVDSGESSLRAYSHSSAAPGTAELYRDRYEAPDRTGPEGLASCSQIPFGNAIAGEIADGREEGVRSAISLRSVPFRVEGVSAGVESVRVRPARRHPRLGSRVSLQSAFPNGVWERGQGSLGTRAKQARVNWRRASGAET